MPEYQSFLKGFGLYENLRLGNWLLTHIRIEHNEVVKYKSYEYPIELTFHIYNSSATVEELQTNLNRYTNQNKIINSKYGNPYNCILTGWNFRYLDDKTILAYTVGKAERIYK